MERQKEFAPLEIKISNGVSKRFLTGFTLIELLVVISIIALLVSVLMPALNKAKKIAQAAICLSNLHEFGVASKMYTQDHGGLMPPRPGEFDWPVSLRPYYLDKKLLICPSAKKTYVPPLPGVGEVQGGKFHAWIAGYGDDDEDEEIYVGSYGINLFVGQNDGGGRGELLWGNLNIVKGAAYIPVLTDSAWDEDTPLPSDSPPDYDGEVYPGGLGYDEMKDRCLNRHNKAINVLFADWHVSKVGLKGLWHLWWHPGWPQALEDAGGPPDFITITADYNGWMAHMKDYAP